MRLVLFTLLLELLAGHVAAQEWAYDNPSQEKAALDSVIEDKHEEIVKAMKKDESPEYPLIYGKSLPIPPVKEPTQ
jgi:hypothetical protein